MLYKDLQPSTWGVYHFILERKNHKSQRFFWKIKKIAEETGLNYRSIQRAEKQLESAGVIKFVKRHPHCKEYKFIKRIFLAESDQSPMSDHTGHPCPITLDTHVRSLSPFDTTQTRMNTNVDDSQKVGEQYLLTDTINNNSTDDLNSYNYLCKKFGKDTVDVAVVYCKKYNGDARNFWGLVHWSCQTGIAPSNKHTRQKEADEKRKKFDEEKAEKYRKEFEQLKIESDNADRELANNLIADFLAEHGDDK